MSWENESFADLPALVSLMQAIPTISVPHLNNFSETARGGLDTEPLH